MVVIGNHFINMPNCLQLPWYHVYEKYEDTKVLIRTREMDRQTDNTTTKGKGNKGQAMIYKTLHRKLKIEQHL